MQLVDQYLFFSYLIFLFLFSCAGKLVQPGGICDSLLLLSYITFLATLLVVTNVCKIFTVSGALHDVLHLHDVLARVALARLCYSISRARALDGIYHQQSSFFMKDIVGGKH